MKRTVHCSLLILAACLSGCRSSGGGNSGTFVEARTASVFAGACHYGAEFTTAGNEAVLAWSFDGGPACGADVVAIVSSERNLALNDEDRRSVVFIKGPESACRSALIAIDHRGVLGEVVSVQSGAEIFVEGDQYLVTGGSGVELSGGLLPDRACCSMPSHVWYEPLAAEESAVVGKSDVFRCIAPELGLRFASGGENDAFVGSFTW